MKSERYLQWALDIDPSVDLSQVMISGNAVAELMDNFKVDLMKKINVDEDSEIDEDDDPDRCPACGSMDIGKLDNNHDVCGACREYWEVGTL